MQDFVWHTVGTPPEKKLKRKREPDSELPPSALALPDTTLSVNQLGSVCVECFRAKVKCSRRTPCDRCTRKGLSCVAQGRGRGRPRKSYEDLSTENVVHSLCTRPASFIRKSWNRFSKSLTEFVSSVLGSPEDEPNKLTYQQKLSMLTSMAGFVSMRQSVLQSDVNERSSTDDWVRDRSSLLNMILQVWTIISKGTESMSEQKLFQGLPACPEILRDRDLSWLPISREILSGPDPLYITQYVMGQRRQMTNGPWNLTFSTADETDAAIAGSEKMKSGPLGRLQLFPLFNILPKSEHANFVEQYSNRFFSDFTYEEYDSFHGKIEIFVSINKTTCGCIDRRGQTIQGSLWIYNFVGYGGKLFGRVIRFLPKPSSKQEAVSCKVEPDGQLEHVRHARAFATTSHGTSATDQKTASMKDNATASPSVTTKPCSYASGAMPSGFVQDGQNYAATEKLTHFGTAQHARIDPNELPTQMMKRRTSYHCLPESDLPEKQFPAVPNIPPVNPACYTLHSASRATPASEIQSEAISYFSNFAQSANVIQPNIHLRIQGGSINPEEFQFSSEFTKIYSTQK